MLTINLNKGMAANDVDDIFTLIEILIQRDVLTKMPVYVIMNPTDVPLKKMDWGEFSHLKGKMDSIVENQEKMSAAISTLLETLDDHLNKILGHMSGTRDCLQNDIECVQSSVKSLDSVIENIQATQSIQCKQTQKLIEVQDSDGDLLSELTWASQSQSPPWIGQPMILNHLLPITIEHS